MQDFKKLKAWQKGHALAVAVYVATREFPREEVFGLTAQLRRSAISVPSNIAEGCGRGSGAELARFLQIALGSASELEYQIILAHDVGYLSSQDRDNLLDQVTEVRRMLWSLRDRVKSPTPRFERPVSAPDFTARDSAQSQ